MRYKSLFPKIMDMLADRLDQAKQIDVAKVAGVSKGMISRLANREQDGITLKNFLGVMDGLGLKPSEVFADVIPSDGDFDYIPHVKAKLGAGYSLETSDEVDGHLAFRKTFLSLMGPVSRLVLFDVRGDSMEPTVKDRDTVLVNTSETDIHSGDLYAIRIGDEISIKRLERLPGKILVKSDNPGHHSYEVDLNEIDGEFAVIGRVRWIGRIV